MEREKELQQLAERIKQIRLEKGMTQLDLASRINKDYTAITRMESGKINPTYTTLLQIAEGLEISVSDLLEGF